MADEQENGTSSEAATQLTFNIKSSSDQKHVVTVPDTMTVQELKRKLSTSEFADITPDRQRLIYAGRVLKDPDTLASYKIKDGNTVHLVKGAANTARQQPSNQGSSTAQNAPNNSGVPQNIAAGTGGDPLAGLTGARYAGFAQMPGAGMFGPDGGMGPPQSPDDLLRMLENPMFQSQMNEAMNNPQVIQMMQNNPMMRDQPMMREMLNNPDMRRMMMDPQVIRASLQMQQMMGGDRGQQAGGMPMPGVTDNTPQPQGGDATTQQQGQNGTAQQSPPSNPFAMFGQPQAGGQMTTTNPFTALFGGAGPGATNTPTSPNTASSETQNGQQQQQPLPNPFSSLFGAQQAGGAAGRDPIEGMAQRMMQNPEMMREMMAYMGREGAGGMGSPANPAQPGAGGSGAGAGAFNPFAMLGGGGMGGMGGQQQPQDTRPPEEMYAEQIHQLNDMGFFDFERNVRALRMCGGRVEGAIEMLLGGGV